MQPGFSRMPGLNNNNNTTNNNNNALNSNANGMMSQNKNPFASQQASIGSNLLSATNNNNLMNMVGLNNGLNSATPQIQTQLIESFRLACQAGLISPDLLNTKLPPDVLSLLYQLFQTLNQYMNSNNKLSSLNKRRQQMSAQMYKAELDLVNQEAQAYKDSLLALQNKINAAHMQLKQQNSGGLTPTGGSNNESLASAAAAAGVPLSDLPLLNKDSQRHKLLDLLGDNRKNSSAIGANQLNRQSSLQPQSVHGQTKLQTQTSMFSSYNSFNSGNQWSNAFAEPAPPIDDRITPFIPGQLWAGNSSIEDDPNRTPGSVSKPLHLETIDPESILSSLSKTSSQWSSSLGGFGDLGDSLLNSGLGSMSRVGANRTGANSSWSGNNFSAQLQQNNQNSNLLGSGSSNGNGNNAASSSISEQLWGVRSSSRGGSQAVGPSNNNNKNNNGHNASLNRNSASFNQNPLMNQQQQQQSFYRSNSWNVNPQQQQQQQQQQLSSSQDSRTAANNFNVNGGHFVLIRNVTPQIDQSTLKALCAQHANGALTYYRYITQMTCVLVRYNTKEEANNALSKLNGIPLGNSTIFTQQLSESDLKFLFTV
jgi:hypothetical protein